MMPDPVLFVIAPVAFVSAGYSFQVMVSLVSKGPVRQAKLAVG